MIHFAVTTADISEDQWMYTVQYRGRIEEVTTTLPLEAMSVMERQKAIAQMLSVVFGIENQEALDTRPGHTPEGQMLNDIFESLDDEEEQEDDNEG